MIIVSLFYIGIRVIKFTETRLSDIKDVRKQMTTKAQLSLVFTVKEISVLALIISSFPTTLNGWTAFWVIAVVFAVIPKKLWRKIFIDIANE